MDFIDDLRRHSERVRIMKPTITTEEATKTSLIMPFFAMLGYDVFNLEEFLPEFVADVADKKGEKVDYAIFMNGAPVILIECKWIGENLNKHSAQLIRYFTASTAKFGILTNGQIYRFYTDLEEPNKMDKVPFLEVDMLNLKEALVPEIEKFHKSKFNVSQVLDTASELQCSNKIKGIMEAQLAAPTNEFVRVFLQTIYPGVKTQAILDKYRPIVKKSLNQYISEMMNDLIKSALDTSAKAPTSNVQTQGNIATDVVRESRINTTEEELEAFFLIKHLLRNTVPIQDICYKDTESYLGILYRNNIRKWICRLNLTGAQRTITIPDENKCGTTYPITSIHDIENYKNQLVTVATRYMQPSSVF